MARDGFNSEIERALVGEPNPFCTSVDMRLLHQEWAVGCRFCYQHHGGKGRHFANFSVRTGNLLHHMKQHLTSSAHKQSVAKKTLGVGKVRILDPENTINHGVPATQKWCWAIETCHASLSIRSFKHFAKAHDHGTTAVMNDCSKEACVKLITCMGSVINDDTNNFLHGTVRSAFSLDDRDTTMVLRLKLVRAMPKIEVRDVLGGVSRELPGDVKGCADKTKTAFRIVCSTREGRQDIHATSDCIDTRAHKRLLATLFCGASDGAITMLDGIQELKKSGALPALRYQFRDMPHTVRTCVKGTVKHCILGNDVYDALISGQGSFCKRIRYCPAMKDAWAKVQVVEAEKDTTYDLYAVWVNLGYAEPRFDGQSTPMSIICRRIDVVLKMLVLVSKDTIESHSDARKWAISLLRVLSGKPGFVRLVTFGCESDFHNAAADLVRMSDVSSVKRDISLSDVQCLHLLEILKALFWEGRVFAEEASSTYTCPSVVSH